MRKSGAFGNFDFAMPCDQSRRAFLHASTVAIATTFTIGGCAQSGESTSDTDGVDAGEGTDGNDPTGGSEGSAGEGSSGSGPVCGVEWSQIPDQQWVVGQPVEFDLSPYLEGADATMLAVALEGALPDGLTLSGSIISGTPSAPFEGDVVATVDVEAC